MLFMKSDLTYYLQIYVNPGKDLCASTFQLSHFRSTASVLLCCSSWISTNLFFTSNHLFWMYTSFCHHCLGEGIGLCRVLLRLPSVARHVFFLFYSVEVVISVTAFVYPVTVACTWCSGRVFRTDTRCISSINCWLVCGTSQKVLIKYDR